MHREHEELEALLERKKHLRTLVEGKNDVAALTVLGFTAVEELGRQPLYQVVERFDKGDSVQLLMDLDGEGKKLLATLRADLTQRGVRVDTELRDALFATPIRQIEHLATWLNNL